MANAIQKITLSASRDIPFNRLALSQSNVRRVKAGVSIEELAEDMARPDTVPGGRISFRPRGEPHAAHAGRGNRTAAQVVAEVRHPVRTRYFCCPRRTHPARAAAICVHQGGCAARAGRTSFTSPRPALGLS